MRNTIAKKVGVPSRQTFFIRIIHLFRLKYAMSEPPRPTSDSKKPELKDLVIALRGVVEYHDLGLQLDLPESELALIDKHPVEDRLRMMLWKWLQFDPEASWEKLATALSKIGKKLSLYRAWG